MHTIIHRQNHSRFPNPASTQDFRSPHFDCMDLPSALKTTPKPSKKKKKR